MVNNMKLHIVSAQQLDTYVVSWISIETDIGNFVVQPGHAPMVLTLAPQKPLLFQLAGGKQEYILISRGVIEVNRQDVTALLYED